ncbi:protein PALE CRESS, chloroplastic-like isoform X1 [Magnolia sinica]|uniref:protein PALE CRESS, chloroplastic-like isoform X1 n=1 Tax=Magnolia sinica TaxID=86752 RepID=UPI002659FD6E|nr:protein PALE CRESS, chloroplastic-like isoform X1 [Magnolia sinica]
MAANAFPTQLTPPLLSNSIHARKTLISPQNPFKLKSPSPGAVVVRKAKKEVELDEYGVPKEYDPNFGLPKEIWDDEWQARQREKTTELHRRRQEEDEEENRKVAEYREVGTRLKAYPEEEVRKARRLVSSFITSAEEVEEKIEEAADKGELTELVLMVIWNRLDLARRDDEKDAIRSLDLLYRRVEMEILKREATPSMRLLNDLLNLHDGFHDEEWLKECRKRMIDTFPREDPFSILVPAGLDIDKGTWRVCVMNALDLMRGCNAGTQHVGRIGLPPEDDEMLLRADFIREVDALLQEVRSEQDQSQTMQGFDPESVATRLKQQEKQQAVRQVEALLDLAITLKW